MEEELECACPTCSKKHILGLCAAITGACMVFVGHILMIKK